ncbi:hypothetical protein [Arthrobacter sp. N1]
MQSYLQGGELFQPCELLPEDLAKMDYRFIDISSLGELQRRCHRTA